MNLWIRSQDRERLVQVKYLDLVYDEIDEENEEYRIYTYIDKERQYLLGTYISKERALEVLDEINKVKFYKYLAELNFEHFIKVIQKYNEKEKNILLNDMNTYEMPKE